jgi:hypothetical protein
MKMRFRLLNLVAVVLGIIFIQTALAEETKKAPSQEEMMAAYAKYAQPGEFHKYLEPLVGNWDCTVKMWMDPSAPPQESKTTNEAKWILGGRFVQEDASGTMGDMPFHGMGITGYDNVKNEYVAFWIDEMGTSFTFTSGKCDSTGKVITMYGSYTDPMSNMAEKKFKTITRIVDSNQHFYEMYNIGPDGKEVKLFEMTYNRKK